MTQRLRRIGTKPNCKGPTWIRLEKAKAPLTSSLLGAGREKTSTPALCNKKKRGTHNSYRTSQPKEVNQLSSENPCEGKNQTPTLRFPLHNPQKKEENTKKSSQKETGEKGYTTKRCKTSTTDSKKKPSKRRPGEIHSLCRKGNRGEMAFHRNRGGLTKARKREEELAS